MKEQMEVGLQPFNVVEKSANQEPAKRLTVEALQQRLPEGLEIPRDKRGKVSWRALSQDPVTFERFIEAMGQLLLDQGIELVDSKMRSDGYAAFATGISKFYPGGFNALREKFGIAQNRKRRGFWKEPETVEREARAFYEANGNLNRSFMDRQGRGDLSGAISNYYPGGLTELKVSMGIPIISVPDGYWTTERILTEARIFLEQEGGLNHQLLINRKKSGLSHAASKFYEGGLRQLQIDLGITKKRKPGSYWNPKTIEREARNFLEQENDLSISRLISRNRSDLANAVRKYPGGMRQLRIELGFPVSNEPPKPPNYWTKDRVEVVVFEVYFKNGLLTRQLLRDMGMHSVNEFIRKKYPGGMKALREKLGIVAKDPAIKLLEDYEAVLQSGEAISFEEFVRRENNAGV